MKIQFIFLLFLISLIAAFSPKSLAQSHNTTLVISDVDDTIKQANVQSKFSFLLRARDDKSRFLGMSELYQWIGRSQENVKFYYVSNAPARWMEKTHLRLLENGNFPEGSYHPRRNWDASVHKINTISRIIENQKPARVIFFGDNTQKDATFYSYLTNKYRNSGIEFHTFIRIVYPTGRRAFNSESNRVESTDPVQKNQFAFVTPVEVSIELFKRQVLPEQVPQWFMTSIIPFILKENPGQARGLLAFPNYIDCRGFQWPYPSLQFGNNNAQSLLLALEKRINWRCSRSADSVED